MSTARAEEEYVQVYCLNGHAISVWGNPVKAKPGKLVQWWGHPLTCGKCGAMCQGGQP